MNQDHFYDLFVRCIRDVEYVPPATQGRLIEVAEAFLKLALGTEDDAPAPNAPTTPAVH